MRTRVYIILCLAWMVAGVAFSQQETDGIRIISYNIWYDNPGNTGNTWSDRREDLKKSIVVINPAIVSVQEALAHQVADLESLGFAAFGAGRDDGKQAGEHTAIFYRPERFSLAEGGNFWLSPWPDSIGSIGWNAMLPRIATWVRLEDRQSGASFYVFNTHFSHVGDTARLESARLLMRQIERIAGASPVILTGDFNCRKGSPPYDAINHSMKDARYSSPQTRIPDPA